MRAGGHPFLRAMPLTVGLLLAIGGVPTLAADAADEEAGLCRVISIDVIADMTGQQYEETPFWDLADNCKYLATSDPDGSHYVRLHLDGLYPYDRYLEGALDPVELEIGGHRAFLASDVDPRGWLNTQVAVDLGDVTLRTTVILDEGADPDQMDDTVRITEIALAGLGDESSPTEPSPDDSRSADVPGLELPALEGFEWRGDIEAYGAGISDLEDAGMNLPFEVLLEALGADIERLGFRTATIRDSATGEDVGNYLAVRVAGADTAELEPAALTWLASLLGTTEVSAEPVSIGDREVLTITLSADEQAYVYVDGDSVHLLSMPEAVAASMLEALS
jgi:hypothetical protein